MIEFTGDADLGAYFDGDALVLRDETTKGTVLVEAKVVVDYLAFLQKVVTE